MLLRPLAVCADYLNASVMHTLFARSLTRVHEVVRSLGDFRSKHAGRVFELLATMKRLAVSVGPAHELVDMQRLHLCVALNMLKYPHYNAKMNALKEICRMIESARSLASNSQSSSMSMSNQGNANNNGNGAKKITIRDEMLIEWIVGERVLSLAVEGGNIDQAQYCDKLKAIVEFIGDRITNDELHTLWIMQVNTLKTFSTITIQNEAHFYPEI